MPDNQTYSVTLLTIQADLESPVHLTNHPSTLVANSTVWVPAPEMDVSDLPDKTGGLDSKEGTIKGLNFNTSDVLARIAGGYPYNQIEVTMQEAFLDDDLLVTGTRTHFTGLVYQGKPTLTTGFMSLVVKGWKYYTDVVAGLPCTEYCAAPHFGDLNLCQATVGEESVVVDSVSGNDVVLTSTPPGVDFLYNKGFFKLKGTSIKIKFWESGDTFQTSEPMPASWVGVPLTLVVGCDKALPTCRDIHDNEEHFSGWGYSMITYNPQSEDNT